MLILVPLFALSHSFFKNFFLIQFHSLEKSNLRWARHRLETDVCVASQQAADPEVIQNYVKKVGSEHGTSTREKLHGLCVIGP